MCVTKILIMTKTESW